MSGQEQHVQPSPALAPVTGDPIPPVASGVAPSSEAGFRLMFESTYRPLLAYARRRLADHADADDLVAEVFAVAWRRRAEIRTGVDGAGSPLPWLYGIAGNVLRNQRRAGQRRLRLVDEIGAQPAVTATAPDPADRSGADIRAALDGLPHDDQELLRLVAWEGLSHADVAEVLGCSVNAVAIRVHRARQRLADQLRLADQPDPSHPAP